MMHTTHIHTSRPWESMKTCSSSEGIRCCTLTSARFTSKCRHRTALWGWVGVFVLLSTPLISPGGKVGGQAFASKRRGGKCWSEREKRGKETRKVERVRSFLCWWQAKHFHPVSPVLPRIRAGSLHGLLSTYVSLLLFILWKGNSEG